MTKCLKFNAFAFPSVMKNDITIYVMVQVHEHRAHAESILKNYL